MKLIASLVDRFFNELLCELVVESDAAEPLGGVFKRKVAGRLKHTESGWAEFVAFWQQPQWARTTEGGILYFPVTCLQVDYDLYGHGSLMNVDGTIVRLVLFESFDGTTDEYRREVEERNRRFIDYFSAWQKDNLSSNDVRELLLRPRINNPLLDKPLPKETLAKFRENYLNEKRMRAEWRNYLP